MIQTIQTYNFTQKEEELVRVDSIISRGMVRYSILGNLSSELAKSKEKILEIIKYNKIKIPYARIISNLYPNQSIKKGSHYDLPIIISILSNILEFKVDLSDYLICGEMDLEGNLIEIHNPIRIVNFCKSHNISNIILPKGNYLYINQIPDINIYMAENLKQVINHLKNTNSIIKICYESVANIEEDDPSLASIIGQESLVRALTIALAGRHSLLIKGPIGTGKTMSLNNIERLLPDLSLTESMIVSDIYSRYFGLNKFINRPKAVYPNNQINEKKLFGSDRDLGMLPLANYSILVFDEFNLYKKVILERVKNLLDNNQVLNYDKIPFIDLPRSYTLIATMNPCPCGNFNTDKKCNCTMGEIARHNSKIDPAMLDRFSMKINVNPIKEIYKNSELTNDIVKIKNMISQARFMQEKRYNNTNKCNSNLLAHEISEYIAINEEISEILTKISSKYNFSRRKYDNILKISRTIADINGNIDIEKNDIFEAIHYA